MAESLQNEDDLLIRYLDEGMNEQEKAAFEARLQQEPALKEKLESLMVAVEAVRQYGTASQVKAIHEELMPELRPRKAKVVTMSRFVRYSMAAAASVILLFVASRFFFNQPSADRLYTEAFVPFDASASRGEGAASPIENLYRKADYTGVTRLASGGAPMNNKDSLLAGISFLQAGTTSRALGYFRILSSRTPQPYMADIEYYEAMTLLKGGYYAEAAALMQQIHNDVSNPYHTQFSEAYI